MTVLVIGARSGIGTALVGDLVARGAAVRVLRRTPGPAPDGAEAVVGDLADRASLDAALRGVDRVFLLSTPAPDAVVWHRAAVDAAAAAGVRHLVRSSLLGADPGSPHAFLRQHGESDAHLAASGVPHTVLRPNYFLQNVPQSVLPSVGPDGSFTGSAGDARLSMVDVRDVGAAAAAVLLDGEPAGRVYELTGPQALSQADVAAALSTHLGRPVRYTDVPLETTRAALAGFGLDPWLADAIVGLYAAYRGSGPDGYAARVSPDLPGLLGRAPRTLADLLAEHRVAA